MSRPTRLRWPEGGRQKSPGDRGGGPGGGTSNSRRVDTGGPRTRAMSHPGLKVDVTAGLAGLARLQALFAEDGRPSGRFWEGAPFSAPPLRPRENNRVFNLPWS